MLEPKQLSESELEMLRQKKLKNKEDYKKRKEKTKQNKLNVILEKQKNLLKKDLRLKKAVLNEQLKAEVEKEIFSETGIYPTFKPRPVSPPVRAAVNPSKQVSKRELVSTPSPAVTDSSSQPSSKRASTSKYAKKRKITDTPPTANGDTKPSKENLKKKTIMKPKQLQNRLYCLCKQPYDNTKFYVGCDICANWFHGSCVGILEDDAQQIDSFTCDPCKQKQQESTDELYCICRTPYDESKFYVGCDECEDWFHPQCVGISQSEAEAKDSYVCPSCSKSASSASCNLPVKGHVAASLKKLVKSLQMHEMSWPFLQPVDPTKVPDYYEVITDPMDLFTLANKLKSGSYSTVAEFAKDATKIFNNARYYNAKDTPIFHCAEVVEKFFVQKLKELKTSAFES